MSEMELCQKPGCVKVTAKNQYLVRGWTEPAALSSNWQVHEIFQNLAPLRMRTCPNEIGYFIHKLGVSSDLLDISRLDRVRNKEQIVNYFDYIPDEILYKIVSMMPPFDLCRLADVSQRLHRMCTDKRLWNNLSLTGKLITFSNMELLIKSSFPIRKLNLSFSMISGIPYCTWVKPFNFHMMLEKLDLTRYGKWNLDSNDDILYILERSRTKELILDLPRVEVDSELMEAISKHENLEVLSMTWTEFYRVTVNGIRTLFNGCSCLKELNLTRSHLTPQQLRAVCNHIPETVEKLVLTYVYLTENTMYIDGEINDDLVESYEVLFRRAKNLMYLGAPLKHLKMPAIMDRIVQHKNLESLCLCEFDVLKPDLFSVLEKVAPKLKRIDILLKKRTAGHGQVSAELEKLRKAFIGIEIGIDIEIYDVSEILWI